MCVRRTRVRVGGVNCISSIPERVYAGTMRCAEVNHAFVDVGTLDGFDTIVRDLRIYRVVVSTGGIRKLDF